VTQEVNMMMKRITSLALAGALSVGAVCQSLADPVPTNSTALKAATPNAIADVRWGGGWGWRGGGRGWRGAWWPGAVIGGLALGPALAAGPYYAYPYGGPYWGGGYAGYRYRPYYGRCVTREGYGRFDPCD
jgi:hypothetical protein